MADFMRLLISSEADKDLLCECIIAVLLIYVGGMLLIMFGKRIWEMREAELELKRIKERERSNNGF
jgi:hypothetical protein